MSQVGIKEIIVNHRLKKQIMKIKNIVYIAICIFAIILIFFLYTIIPFYLTNNDINWNDLVFDKMHSFADIQLIKEKLVQGTRIYCWNLVYDFKIDFKYKRKCIGGYYSIVKTDEPNYYAFIFYDTSLRVINIYCQSHFKNRSDYSFIKPGFTTIEEMHQYDNNYIELFTSSAITETYILKEDYLIVGYDAHVYSDHKVLYYDFIKYDFLIEEYGEQIFSEIPYILEKDRCF